MKCSHCNEELGQGDSYDLMTSHLPYCESKIAHKVMKTRDAEQFGYREDDE